MADSSFVDGIPVSRIFLALNNPRHPPVEQEAKAIERLCQKEDILPLARDIRRHGVNPLERLALVPIDKRRAKRDGQAYRVMEGNRRICALKLLIDPDLAPPSLRRPLEKLANGWTPITTISAAVFPTDEDVRLWLDRTHNGPQGGIGRRTWDAEQKQRFYGEAKNRLAQGILDYAQQEGMITQDERRGKLTTTQRFVGNSVFKEVLGIDESDPENVSRTRPKAEFDSILKRFIRDLVGGEAVTSRMNKADIVRYARPLGSTPGVTTARIDAEPLSAEPSGPTRQPKSKPRPPTKPKTVSHDSAVEAALRGLGNYKLASLYHSITSIELEHHTPLVCVGAWSFLETLTACAGRSEASFEAYLSKQRLTNWGITAANVKSLVSAVHRIAETGNSTKHHQVAGAFSPDQLNNDMVALQPVILACIAAVPGG